MIGATSPMRELAVLAYALAAFACFRAMQRSSRGELDWALLVIAFGGLAINHLFGLLDIAVGFLRALAEQQAWYGDRRSLQREVIVGVALFGAVAAPILFVGLHRQIWQLRVAALAALGLMALAVIRAISLHSIDVLFARPVWGLAPFRLGSMIELTGIAVTIMVCMAVPRRAPKRRAPTRRTPRRRRA